MTIMRSAGDPLPGYGTGDGADTAAFEALVHARKSVRAFRPDPVPRALIDHIVRLASQAPSNCNTQPWTVHIASGDVRNSIADALIAAGEANNQSPDIPYHWQTYPEDLRERQAEHLSHQQAALGIERTDPDGRMMVRRANMNLFGAPHAAFLFIPAWSNEREAADLGLFAQTLMLALTAFGLASCPQTSVGLQAAPIKRILGIDSSMRLMFAISFGYEQTGARAARLEQRRLPLDAFLTHHGTDPAA